LTSYGTVGDSGEDARQIRVSLLVNHLRGATVQGLRIDQDWDSVDETLSAPLITTGLDIEQPTIAGGFNYSRVNYEFKTTVDTTTGDWITRQAPLRLRVIMKNDSATPSVSSDVRFVTAIDKPGNQPPYIRSWSYFGSSTPGTRSVFRYAGKDPDLRECRLFGSCTPDSDLLGANFRTRNQLDGTTGAPSGIMEGCNERASGEGDTFSADLTLWSRGTYVVEGLPLNWDGFVSWLTPWGAPGNTASCVDGGGFWMPLGSLDVNSPTIPQPSVTFTPARPVPGQDFHVSAVMPRDPDHDAGGRVQIVEWDLDGNPNTGPQGFEVANAGSFDTGYAPGTELRWKLNPAFFSPGQHTVRVRVTDNGAMSAADDVRASSIGTAQFLANSPPAISEYVFPPISVGVPLSIPLSATDADSDPLNWSIGFEPLFGDGSLTRTSGATTSYRYIPDEGFAGSDTVQFDVADGWGGTDRWTIELIYRPETSIDSAPRTASSDRTASFEFSSDATTVGFECRLTVPGAAAPNFESCISPAQYRSLPEGELKFEVRAVPNDRGPADPTPAAQSWRVDATPPVVAIDSKPAALSNDPSPSFSFSGNEQGSFQCRLDAGTPSGTAWQDCGQGLSGEWSIQSLAEGTHSFEVRQTDPAGNSSTSEHDWSTDLTAPLVTFSGGPVGATTSRRGVFQFSATDRSPLAPFARCSVDDRAPSACTSPFVAEGLSPGRHEVIVRVSDLAGNQGAATRRFTVIRQPRCGGLRPTLTGTSGPDDLFGTPGRDVIFGGGARDTIFSRGGNDLVCGGPGNDRLLGGAGKDTVLGGMGADALNGGPGFDLCRGGKGADTSRRCEQGRP
jgi:hypothetical protein